MRKVRRHASAPSAQDASKQNSGADVLPELKGIEEKLHDMDGAVVAELLVRLLVRVSYCDISALVVDSVIYAGQDEGVHVKQLLHTFDMTGTKKKRDTFEGIVKMLASQTVLHIFRENVYGIDYLWAFHLAEVRYREVMKQVEDFRKQPTSEFYCTRCAEIFVGEFAIFKLTRKGTTFYCNKSGCGGRVDERVLDENVKRHKLHADCEAHLHVFRAILNHKKHLYIPKDAETITSSGDFLSEKQYKAQAESAAVKVYESKIWQMEQDGGDAKRGLLSEATTVPVEFLEEAQEARARLSFEEQRRKRTATGSIPWLQSAEQKTTDQEPEDDAGPAPKRRRLTSMGHRALSGQSVPLHSRTLCHYLARSGKEVPISEDDSFINLSQYFVEKTWEQQQQQRASAPQS